jgi:hypothetical protein
VIPPAPQFRPVLGRQLRWVAAAMLSAAAAITLPSATIQAGPLAGSAESTPRRVLLIVDRADDPFAERIRAEVAGLGLAVVTL